MPQIKNTILIKIRLSINNCVTSVTPVACHLGFIAKNKCLEGAPSSTDGALY